MAYELYDMHCHLGFMSNALEVARDAEALGPALFANTVTPHEYKASLRELAHQPNVRIGVGLPPWWIADGRVTANDVDLAVAQVDASAYVGEVGLDYSPAHADPSSYARQLCVFERIIRACAFEPHPERTRVISIHAVRSASAVLDVLERTDCFSECHCIFHWFSGTSDELHRAVRAGCWFSINEMMLSTRRGREYARQIPEDKLLTETDLPPKEGEPFSAAEIVASLERTLATLQEIRGKDVRHLAANNAQTLLG